MNPETAEIDRICDAFEDQWKSGKEPDLKAVLNSAPKELRILLTRRLVLLDTEYRRAKLGAAPKLQEYAAGLHVDVADLAAGQDTVTYLGPGAVETAQTFMSPPSDEPAETVIGTDESEAELQEHVSAAEDFRLDGYEILGELGRGGMGVVYKARQLKPSRIVALKTIHVPRMADREVVRRFHAEAEAAGRLDHRGIVPVFEVGEQDGVHYFSMGFVEGADLEQKARENVLTCNVAAAVAKEIAEALEYAHQKGVIHRDIKPHNILIDSDGQAKITDFGLAKLSESDAELTASGQIMGTAAYMPPEQATGNTASAGATADVYAVGATLYRCITGRPPFQAASAMEILRQVVDDEPIPPRRLNQEIDADIETLCLKCLEKKPEQRFPTAGNLAAELTRYLSGEPILSRPVGGVDRLWRWSKRRPYVAASSVLAACLFLTISVAIPAFLWQQEKITAADLQRRLDASAVEQAEAVADTQKYYATIRQVREQRFSPDPEPGWTWLSLDLLQEAAASTAVGKDPVELRSLIVGLLTTPDVRERGVLPVERSSTIAVSPSGRLLAIGDAAGVPTSDVNIYEVWNLADFMEPSGVKPSKVCSINTAGDKLRATFGELLPSFVDTTVEREGMRVLAFSADETQLLAGTRNGNVIVWDLTETKPRETFNKRFPGYRFLRAEFTSDGKRALLQSGKSGQLLSVNFDSGELEAIRSGDHLDFVPLKDGRILSSFRSQLIRSDFANDDNQIVVVDDDRLGHGGIHVASDTVAIVLIGDTLHFVDPMTGEFGPSLPHPRGEWRPRRVEFSDDTSSVFAALEPDLVRMWDGLSGRHVRDLEFSDESSPRIAIAADRNLLLVYSSLRLFVYDIRQGRHTGGSVPDIKMKLSHLESPMTVFAPGTAAVTDFAINADGSRMALLESLPVESVGRSRIRILDTATGREIGRHMLACVDTQAQFPWLMFEGNDITFLNDGDLAVAARVPGNVFVIGKDTVQVPSAGVIDAPALAATSVKSQLAAWKSGDPARNGFERLRPTVALRFPRPLFQARETLTLRLITGDGPDREIDTQVVVDDTTVECAGWNVLSLPPVSAEVLAKPWQIEAVLDAGELSFSTTVAGNPDLSGNSVFIGDAWLLPFFVLDDKTVVNVGPLGPRGDDGLTGTIEDTLRQWDGQRSQPVTASWSDWVNSFENINAVASHGSSILAGTDSGQLVLVSTDGQARRLSGKMFGTPDPKGAISTADITPDGSVGVAGNLRGEMMIFDLQSGREGAALQTPESRSAISAVAVSPTGQDFGAAYNNGSLQLWHRTDSGLEMLFEIPHEHKARCTALRFSPDGTRLYFLREGERGVRCLNVAFLKKTFDLNGLGW